MPSGVYVRKESVLQMLRTRVKLIAGTGARPKQTHCQNGHALIDGNLYWKKNGKARCCKTCVLAKGKKKRELFPDEEKKHARRSRLLRNGWTPEEYIVAFALQNGVCAICKKAETVGYNLRADHDHATGNKRELLCHRCNAAIGLLREHPEICRAAADYIEKHK